MRTKRLEKRLITSQNDAAPKLNAMPFFSKCSLITSQNDAAPKREALAALGMRGLITSQNDAAPKLQSVNAGPPKVSLPVKTTLRQNY